MAVGISTDVFNVYQADDGWVYFTATFRVPRFDEDYYLPLHIGSYLFWPRDRGGGGADGFGMLGQLLPILKGKVTVKSSSRCVAARSLFSMMLEMLQRAVLLCAQRHRSPADGIPAGRTTFVWYVPGRSPPARRSPTLETEHPKEEPCGIDSWRLECRPLERSSF